MGHIHVSESLPRAHMDPLRPALSLTREETERLADAILESLRATLADEDSPEPITYVEEGGENVFLVYDRAGQPCSTCGTAIERVVQGGRSTYYCPSCQPRWRARPSRRGRGRAPARKAGRRLPARRVRTAGGRRRASRAR